VSVSVEIKYNQRLETEDVKRRDLVDVTKYFNVDRLLNLLWLRGQCVQMLFVYSTTSGRLFGIPPRFLAAVNLCPCTALFSPATPKLHELGPGARLTGDRNERGRSFFTAVKN